MAIERNRVTPASDLAVALGVVALGGLVLWQTRAIPQTPLYSHVGPTVIPYIAGAAIVLLGAALCVEAWRGGWSHEAEEDPVPPDWRSLAWLLTGLAVNVALIDRIGFVGAAPLQFGLVARAFGSTRLVRDLAIGFAISALAYIGFSRGFGLNIGGGLVDAYLTAAVDWLSATLLDPLLVAVGVR